MLSTMQQVQERVSVRFQSQLEASRPIHLPAVELYCAVCHQSFDFERGESAVVLKHIAYGYDYVHDGKCLETALDWIFVEPGYDRPAFRKDAERERILCTYSPEDWSAVLPNAPEQVLAGDPVSFERLLCWAVICYRDGSQHVEGLVRQADLLEETGAAEFPEARQGRRQSLGYARETDRSNPALWALWESVIRARYSTSTSRR
jgi:hypothetical protein